jgi:hypothetical protein
MQDFTAQRVSVRIKGNSLHSLEQFPESCPDGACSTTVSLERPYFVIGASRHFHLLKKTKFHPHGEIG